MISMKLKWPRNCITALLAIILSGCAESYDCRETVAAYVSTYKEVTITGITSITSYRRLANGQLVESDATTPTSIESLVIDVILNYDAKPRRTETAGPGFLGWFINSAHACSPAFYPGDVESKIVAANLLSTTSFGDEFGAGAALAEAFDMAPVSIPDINHGDNFDRSKVPMQSLSSSEPAAGAVRYELYAQTPMKLMPNRVELHQLTFSITLDTGEMFTATSVPVLISGG